MIAHIYIKRDNYKIVYHQNNYSETKVYSAGTFASMFLSGNTIIHKIDADDLPKHSHDDIYVRKDDINTSIPPSSGNVNEYFYYEPEKDILVAKRTIESFYGIVMFSVLSSDIPSVFDSIPLASTTNKGLAQFDSGYFTAVGGMVSLRDDLNFGLNLPELQGYLSSVGYVTQSWVKTWVSQTDKDLWNGKLDKSLFDELFRVITTPKKEIRALADFSSTGSIVMFSADDSGSGSIFDSIPLASTTNKGLAQFSPTYFTAVGGMVSLRDDLDFGLNLTELQGYLSSAGYTTQSFVKTWVSQADKDSWNGKLNRSTFDEFFTISGTGDNRVITANFPLFSTGSMCMFSVTADGGGGMGGGVANLSELFDVNLQNLSEGQILMYNSVSGKWKNAPKPAYSWGDVSEKPSWIASSKPSYSWSEISEKPDLVLTSDSRLSNARQASDVSAWAKASSKPAYSWGEVTGKPALLNIDPTGGINNSTATNGIWFDYNFAGTSRAGSVISGSGLSGGFPIQLFGDYQTGNVFYLRTKHGDNNTWNTPKLIWHNANANLSTIDWNAARLLLPVNGAVTINGKRTITSDSSGDTYLGGLDAGTNNTILRTNGIERLRITSDGKIGIGTSSPTTTLEVNGVAKFGQQPWRAIIGSSSVTNEVTYGVSDSNNIQLAYIRMGANKLQFSPNTGSNNYNIWHAGNSNLSTVDWNANNCYVNGNILIGTTSIQAKIHAIQTLGGTYAAIFRNNAGMGASYGMVLDGGTNQNDVCARFRSSSTASNTDLMLIRGDGNVGIGTTNPTDKLQVQGNIKTSGSVIMFSV